MNCDDAPAVELFGDSVKQNLPLTIDSRKTTICKRTESAIALRCQLTGAGDDRRRGTEAMVLIIDGALRLVGDRRGVRAVETTEDGMVGKVLNVGIGYGADVIGE